MKKNNTETEVTTVAQLEAQEAAIQANLSQLRAKKDNVQKNEMARVTATIDTIPAMLTSVVGKPVTLAEVLVMIRNRISGKLALVTGKAIRKYRRPMSEDEKNQLRAVLVARQAVIDAGGIPAESISQISGRFNTTDATVNKYKAEWHLTRGTRVAA